MRPVSVKQAKACSCNCCVPSAMSTPIRSVPSVERPSDEAADEAGRKLAEMAVDRDVRHRAGHRAPRPPHDPLHGSPAIRVHRRIPACRTRSTYRGEGCSSSNGLVVPASRSISRRYFSWISLIVSVSVPRTGDSTTICGLFTAATAASISKGWSLMARSLELP